VVCLGTEPDAIQQPMPPTYEQIHCDIHVLYHIPGHKDDNFWAALLYGFFLEEEFDSSAKCMTDITTVISESKTADNGKQRNMSGNE
jgi:hypothetical protein